MADAFIPNPEWVKLRINVLSNDLTKHQPSMPEVIKKANVEELIRMVELRTRMELG